MSITVHPFDLDRANATRKLFPDEIEDDGWVIYHGTSSANTTSIEADGFVPSNSLVTRATIQRITNVYEALSWAGEDGSGYSALRSWSMNDMDSSRNGWQSFGMTAVRCIMYSTLDYAGGEKLRGLRRALQDLRRYANDEAVRERLRNFWLKQPPDQRPPLLPDGAALTLIRALLADLAPEEALANSASNLHDHGVIYAVRMKPEDARTFRSDPFQAWITEETVPANRIIAKMHIPCDHEVDWTRLPSQSIDDLERIRSAAFYIAVYAAQADGRSASA